MYRVEDIRDDDPNARPGPNGMARPHFCSDKTTCDLVVADLTKRIGPMRVKTWWGPPGVGPEHPHSRPFFDKIHFDFGGPVVTTWKPFEVFVQPPQEVHFHLGGKFEVSFWTYQSDLVEESIRRALADPRGPPHWPYGKANAGRYLFCAPLSVLRAILVEIDKHRAVIDAQDSRELAEMQAKTAALRAKGVLK